MADFAKAFDTVDFKILIRKLQKLNLLKDSLKILASIIYHRTVIIVRPSPPLPVTNGVPQGNILGPVIFNIYDHDMNTKSDAAYHQYADDTSLCRHSKPKDLETCATTLSKDVNEIQGWSNDTNFIFDPKKTKSLLFSTQKMARCQLQANIF